MYCYSLFKNISCFFSIVLLLCVFISNAKSNSIDSTNFLDNLSNREIDDNGNARRVLDTESRSFRIFRVSTRGINTGNSRSETAGGSALVKVNIIGDGPKITRNFSYGGNGSLGGKGGNANQITTVNGGGVNLINTAQAGYGGVKNSITQIGAGGDALSLSLATGSGRHGIGIRDRAIGGNGAEGGNADSSAIGLNLFNTKTSVASIAIGGQGGIGFNRERGGNAESFARSVSGYKYSALASSRGGDGFGVLSGEANAVTSVTGRKGNGIAVATSGSNINPNRVSTFARMINRSTRTLSENKLS